MDSAENCQLPLKRDKNDQLQEKEPFLPDVEVHPVKTDLVPKSKELECIAPKDKFNMVYFIMMIHGIGVLMPWNMFITATAYFVDYKLGGAGDTYCRYFLSALSFVSQIPNVLLNITNLFFQRGGSGNVAIKITSSIIIVVLMFIVTVILAMIDSTTWSSTFFWITMFTVVLMNMANGVYQNSIFGTVSCLPMQYTNAVIMGSNLCGTITAVLNIISMELAPDPQTAAIYYFMAVIVYMVLAYDSYFILPFSAFFCYYRDKSSKMQLERNPETPTHPPYVKIFRKCAVQHLSVWFILFVTLTCFPAILASIKPISSNFPFDKKYFTPIMCFLFFNIFNVLGSVITELCKFPGPRWVWLPVVLRGLFIPFFMFCNFSPLSRSLPVLITNDYVYVLANIVMAFSNGYCLSLCMMYAPQHVEDQYKGTAGMMGSCFLITGVFSGICFSFPVITFIENIGNYIQPLEEFVNATTPRLNITGTLYL